MGISSTAIPDTSLILTDLRHRPHRDAREVRGQICGFSEAPSFRGVLFVQSNEKEKATTFVSSRGSHFVARGDVR
jgi:hypothetical protein